MEYRQFGDKFAVRLDRGEEIVQSLLKLCAWKDIRTAQVTGIGAVGEVTAGLFDTEAKSFLPHMWTGDMEITALVGNITSMEGKPYEHLHISVADREGNVRGGHLKRAVVSATAEIIVTVIDGAVDREMSSEIGLNLMKFLR